MTAPQHTSRYRDRIIARDEVEALIAEGRKIVIVNGNVLKTDAWIPYHPGGEGAVLHMVGRDATNEVTAFHSAETQAFMLKYRIGRIAGQWKDFVPPIQGGVYTTREQQAAIATDAVKSQGQQASDTSDTSGSEPPSPLFEPADRTHTGLKQRRHSVAATSESSATSLSDADRESPRTQKDASTGADRTHKELLYDLETYPSLDSATQADIIIKYKRLDERLRSERLYDCNYAAYGVELMRYTALAALFVYFLSTGWFALSAVFLGLLWHQLVFTVHDAAHCGITHNYQIDSCISILISDFIGGLSACWWKRNHNVHHIVTNSAEHDPDIQHMPFFAISHKFFDSLKSTYYDRIMTYDAVAKFTLQYQHWLYYPILTFGRFNLYVLSWQHIFFGQGPRKGPAKWLRYLEMVGQVFFWYWFGYLVVYRSIPTAASRVLFVAISHAITMPVHVQITLSHFAMSTADLGVAESFPQRMLRTTMDVDCPAWLDFVHGGLQFQAVHHLFPRMPRHNLRRAQVLVREFCEEVGIPYAIYGFVEGNGKVIGRLSEVAKQARILAECQRSIVVGDVLEGH
jgi:sphingolipid 8-(E)-desaturase